MDKPERVLSAKSISFSPSKPINATPLPTLPKLGSAKYEETIVTGKQPEVEKITSLYGLDVDLLRSLNLGDLVEEKTKEKS